MSDFQPPPDHPGMGTPPGATPPPGEAEKGKLQGWHFQFPEEDREILKDYVKPGDFTKAVKELRTKADKGIVLPDQLTDEAVAPILEKLGRPKSSKDYKLEKDPELTYDDARTQAAMDFYHRNGLTQKQVDALWKDQNARYKAAQTAHKAAQEQRKAENAAAVQEMWKEKAPENIERCMQAAVQLGGTNLPAKLKATGLETDPEVLSLLFNLHRLMTDPNGAGGRSMPGTDSLEERYPNTQWR